MTLITWGFGWRIFGALTDRLAEGGRLTTVTGPVASGKTRLLDMLAAQKIPVMAYHFAWPGYGHVAKNGDGFRYYPEPMNMQL